MDQKPWSFFNMLIATSLFVVHSSASSKEEAYLYEKIGNDYSNFVNEDRLIRMGVGFLAIGGIANSDLDEDFQNTYQDDIRGKTTDDHAEIAKLFGEGKYLMPAALLASGLSYFDPDSVVGEWGENTARAYIVGLPAMIAMQNVTGGSRPSDLAGSKWRPFNDENGVSGHSFVGAVPFLTIAHMTDNNFIKYASFVASGLTAWSRTNDHQHYFSQSLFGWYMAYESVGAVFDTNKTKSNMAIVPIINDDFYGVMVSGSW